MGTLFVRSFIHSFIHSFIRSFVRLLSWVELSQVESIDPDLFRSILCSKKRLCYFHYTIWSITVHLTFFPISPSSSTIYYLFQSLLFLFNFRSLLFLFNFSFQRQQKQQCIKQEVNLRKQFLKQPMFNVMKRLFNVMTWSEPMSRRRSN